MKILAHTSFIGTTGYANHARSFFCALNKYHDVKVRNLTIGNGWKGFSRYPHNNEPYITDEIKRMLILQTLTNSDGTRSDHNMYAYKGGFVPDVHIVLNETNNYYFYENYDGYKIAYNVWESTRYPDDFFKRLFYFDEVWVPTQWQKDSLIEQGYPKEKISIVTEGVDINIFKPAEVYREKEKFRFLYFGRWDYRKSTTEVLKTFGETFKGNNDVELICSVENPYPSDGMSSTEERKKFHKIDYDNIKYINFLSREDYIDYLQQGDVFVSCARSEGWNLPLEEAMACGTPSLYTNWGAQLQFAEGKGVPVNISHMRPANIGDRDVAGEYCEPDFKDLSVKLKEVYENYNEIKKRTIEESKVLHEEFNWDKVAKDACEILNKKPSVYKSEEIEKKESIVLNETPFVFVTTGNIGYMPVIEKLVLSLNEFSGMKILVYGVNCDVPFDYPNVIKRRIDPPFHSIHDKWYWKQYACIEAINEDFENYVWMDGDVVVNYNIDEIKKYFSDIETYPIPDIHVQEEFFGTYGEGKSQLFNQEMARELNVTKFNPYAHICMYVYNKSCKWWFEKIIELYTTTPLEDYKRLFLWNDEGIDNGLRWTNNFRKFLPVSNFDTSSYDGDLGVTNQTLNQFYKFWNEDGPKNFGNIYGYQYIPKDKSNILYFHGNKDSEISDKMIEFIKLKRDNNFYQSKYFYTGVYEVKNLGSIFEYEGSAIEVANKFGWDYTIFHEIYNLREYYLNRERKIFDGDVVVDLGGNIGIFNRWAYSEGASKVISFEPDKRYFNLLSLNSDPRSILFNAAIGDKIGEIDLYESDHLGGSFTKKEANSSKQKEIYSEGATVKYKTRTYTLNYLFDTGLIDRIDFLKIDIEGAEIEALNGISDENLKKVKTISMEYHHAMLDFDENLRTNFMKRLRMNGFNSHILFLGDNNQLQLIYFWK